MNIGNNINPGNVNINDKLSSANDIKSKLQDGKSKLQDAKSKLQGGKDKLNKTKEQLEKVKGKLKNKDAFKNVSQPSEFLKEQSSISPGNAKLILIGLVTPLLSNFLKVENSFDIILNRLIKQTEEQLKDKGKVEVKGTVITFTPKDTGNYLIYKQNFDRSVNKLKELVSTLKKIISSLNTVLSFIRTGLAALKLVLSLNQNRLKVQSAASAAELASPSPSKPSSSAYIVADRIDRDVTPKLQEKIDKYLVFIEVIKAFLKVFEKILKSLELKLSKLNLLITNSNNTYNNTSNQLSLNTSNSSLSNNEENTFVATDGKSYTLEIITTPSGALQAIARDSFSKLKIAQTAPSKTRGVDELFNELKQILG